MPLASDIISLLFNVELDRALDRDETRLDNYCEVPVTIEKKICSIEKATRFP